MIPTNQQAGTIAVRRAIKQKRSPELSLIEQYGEMFLERKSIQNNVSFDEFRPYLPLYIKDQLSKLSEEERQALSFKHAQRFNIQEPIRILDLAEPDENGSLYPADNKRYKVIITLPARTRRIDSINKLGGNTVALAAELLAGTRTSSNPFDNKGEYYSEQLARLLEMANKQNIAEQDAQYKKYAKDVLKPEEAPKQATKPEENRDDFNPEGIDDATWE